MDDVDNKLHQYGQQIMNYLTQLKKERDEMSELISRQREEKTVLESELERIVYKLKLIDKNLVQRIAALQTYDTKISEAENKYTRIVERSESLLFLVKNDLQELENMMDKRTGTHDEEKVAEMTSVPSNTHKKSGK